MDIAHFDDLLRAARAQPQPQRLLLVFAAATLPDGASAAQRAAFEAGEGGELAPLMCVDKDPAEWADFDALRREAAQAGGDGWVIVFASTLSGAGDQPPAAAQVDAALDRMVEQVRLGQIGGFIPFDRSGRAVRLG
ncbi:MAG: ribonucleotide reductase subunit alpha [Burkholderiaceae bacterium]